MTPLSAIVITLKFILICASISCAQAPPPPAPALPSSATSTSDSTPPPPPAKPVRTVGKAAVYYFENSNTTRARVNFYVIGSYNDIHKKDVLSMDAAFQVTGKKANKPEFIYLNLHSYSHGQTYKYKDNPKLTIFLDDTLFLSGTLQPDFMAIDPRGGVTENYVTPRVRYDQFLQIIGAKKIRMKFGDTEFEVKGENFEALRDLNRAIEP